MHMLNYAVKRIVTAIPVVLLVTFMVFLIQYLAPGDPVAILLGQFRDSPGVAEAIRKEWGFDQPVYVQYLSWLGRLATGNFGKSIAFNKVPIAMLLKSSIPYTLWLNMTALVFALTIGIVVGTISATRQYSIFDHIISLLAFIGISMPEFWLGLMLMIVFAVKLRWFPLAGADSWKHVVLPATALGLSQAAVFTRMIRSSVIEVLRMEYVQTARAKGLAERVVLFKHVFKNAAIPVITLIGLRLAYLISGTVVIEFVFAWPGTGRLVANALFRRDYFVVQAVVTLSALVIVGVNLLIDILYAALDPRIRYS
jgi:peptide/nickel transport system permease protein